MSSLILRSSQFFPKKGVLEFHLSATTRDLFGEVAEARLASLTQALGASELVLKGR